MNYFQFYDIAESFFLSKKQLKKAYLEMSRKYHPDFFTKEDKELQEEALKMSSINSKAYEVLDDFDARMKYILDINNVLEAEGQNKVPNEFLMEMMEINESLMELQFEPDPAAKSKVADDVKTLKESLYLDVEADMMKYVKDADNSESILNHVKDYFLKNKYLKRIEEQLV
jgi:molecular chaperone HscB